MFGFRGFITADLIGSAQPFEMFGCNDDITGMGATCEFTATRAVAILEYILGSVKLVTDRTAEAAAADCFTHKDVPMPIISTLAAV
jgi:hypothetical protein